MTGVNPFPYKENDLALSPDFLQQDQAKQWSYGERLGSQKAANQSYVNRGKESLLSSEIKDVPSFLFQTPLGTPFNEIPVVKKNLEIRDRLTREEPRWEEDKPIRLFQPGQNSSLPSRIMGQVNQITDYLDRPARLSAEDHTRENRAGANNFIQRWYYEEVKLSMNKVSIVGLVVGLMFLGALFFIVGFLAAVATLKPASGEDQAPAVNYGHFFSKMAGDAVARRPVSLLRDMEELPAIAPHSLQPFARYGEPSYPHHQQPPYQKNPFDVTMNTQRTISPPNELPRLPAYEAAEEYPRQGLSQGEQRGYGSVYPQQQPAQRYAPMQPPMQPLTQQLPRYGQDVNSQALYQGSGQPQAGLQGNRPPAAYAGAYYRPSPPQPLVSQPSLPHHNFQQQHYHQPEPVQPVYQQPRVYQPVTRPQAPMPPYPQGRQFQGQPYPLPSSSPYQSSSQQFPTQPLAPAPAYYR